MEIGQQLIVRARALAAGGDAVCFGEEGGAVFCPYLAPGELARVRILRSKSKTAWAEPLEVLEKSPVRLGSPCPLFTRCGGCDWLHIPYAAQLEAKQQIVSDALSRIGGVGPESYEMLPILPSENQLHYRNKATWHTHGSEIGFYARGSRDLLPCKDCLLQMEASVALAHAFSQYAAQNPDCGADAFVTRVGRDGKSLCALLTKQDTLAAAGRLTDALLRVPGLAGIVQCLPMRGENPGPTVRVLYGQPCLEDTLDSLAYEVSPQTFLQVNPPQADRLMETAAAFLQPEGKAVLDLYCGAGALALRMARAGAKNVTGLEIVPEAIGDARRNAARNGISNASFRVASVEDALPALLGGKTRFDCALLDPPRKGCDRRAIDAVGKSGIPRLVYVSCDPATLARDIRLLTACGYRLLRCQPVDMFPQTGHVETVCLLSKL